MITKPALKRALLSVSDKTGLIEFAQQLSAQGIEIIATGGTATLLKQAHIKVIEIAEYTGFPEILDGRVKTLHPKIHAGILARRNQDDSVLNQHEIEFIDLVVVNLYPFLQTIAHKECTLVEAIEQIDIGGPTMIRAAAKNHAWVTVLSDPTDYSLVLDEIMQYGQTTAKTRQALAVKAFCHTADYDAAIARYLQKSLNPATEPAASLGSMLPQYLNLHLEKQQDLRYGENPHQTAALYASTSIDENSSQLHLLQGKTLSFNNILDSETAICCVLNLDHSKAGCVIVKHVTPCGAAQAATPTAAYELAYQTDPTSAFGGIIAFNQKLTAETVNIILNQQFLEVLIAPDFTHDALALCQQKPNLRVLTYKQEGINGPLLSFHQISYGLLAQQRDQYILKPEDLHIVTQKAPIPAEIIDLIFAWNITKFVKSNAIVLARNQITLGIGAGQTSRVFSTEIAILKAQQAHLSLDQAVMASDAFLPFADSVEIAAKVGVSAIIQTGGSKRDSEVIAAADKAGIAMVFTGVRHFRH